MDGACRKCSMSCPLLPNTGVVILRSVGGPRCHPTVHTSGGRSPTAQIPEGPPSVPSREGSYMTTGRYVPG